MRLTIRGKLNFLKQNYPVKFGSDLQKKECLVDSIFSGSTEGGEYKVNNATKGNRQQIAKQSQASSRQVT